MHVGIDGDDDHVREDVTGSDHIEDTGVLHRDLLGDLHHHKDDDQVGTAQSLSVSISAKIRWVVVEGVEGRRGAFRTFEG